MNRKRDPNHLTPESDGRFCKRVRGVLHHFGNGGDRDLALKEWLAVKEDLLAGRPIHRAVPAAPRPGALTLKHVRDIFLTACTAKVDEGKLKAETFSDYQQAVDEFIQIAGAGRDPATLDPADFGRVRREWERGGRLGAWALDRFIQAVRTMFNHAVDVARLLDRQPWYGDQFSKTNSGAKRKVAREKEHERGERAFGLAEIRLILSIAPTQLRAMVLLALNGGMYSKDVAALREKHVKKEAGEWVVDFDRGKTERIGVPWKFVLWPETKTALDAALAERKGSTRWRKVRDPADADRLFLTVHGRPFHREHVDRDGVLIKSSANVDLIAQEFNKLLDGVWWLPEKRGEKGRPLKRDGVGFGAFRSTHITAVGDHPDQFAAKRVRGHLITSIEAHYDRVPVERLKAVTDLARRKLLGL